MYKKFKLKALFVWLLSLGLWIKRRKCLSIFIFILTGVIIIFGFKWKIICVNLQPAQHIKHICSHVSKGAFLGNLCSSLCFTGGVSSISCYTYYLGKEVVFSGNLLNTSLVFKSPKTDVKYEFIHWNENGENAHPDEYEFMELIKSNIKDKFNMIIDNDRAKKLSHLELAKENNSPRHVEINNIWMLMQSNEYLAVILYEKFNIFPKLVGTCGTMFAVENLNSLVYYTHFLSLYDSLYNWQIRVKIALNILEYLQVLEYDLPEPLYICDVKMSHFGTTEDLSKVKLLDLDSVHPLSVLNKILADGSPCTLHSDCDYFDCRSLCNHQTAKCQFGVVNNNLQIVCERIFLGWVMSKKILLAGLLMGFHAPQELLELLERCADSEQVVTDNRAKASPNMHKQLYSMLSHIHQNIVV